MVSGRAAASPLATPIIWLLHKHGQRETLLPPPVGLCLRAGPRKSAVNRDDGLA
jgi:hypothetical protein